MWSAGTNPVRIAATVEAGVRTETRAPRWTEVEAHAHALLADPAADKAAAKKTFDERFALMREVFRKTPSALSVAYISWGEDALWARLGWQPPKP